MDGQSDEIGLKTKNKPKLRSKKPKFATPEELDKACICFLAECEEKNKFPDEASLLRFLDISQDTKERYISNEDNSFSGFAEVLKKQELIRESALVQLIVQNQKDTGLMFLLKQQKNGGYSDKQQADSKQTVEIQIQGVD